MSIDRDDIGDGAGRASPLLARAAAMAAHADRRLTQSIDDFFRPDDARLDERTRAALAAMLAAMVGLIEGDVRRHAARVLGDSAAADQVSNGEPVLDRLIAAGVLGDRALMGEVLARTQQDLLADALPAAAPDESGAASLLARLAASGYGTVAKAALALMMAEARRRGFLDDNRLVATELPAELHHRLLWWVTAAIRDQLGDPAADAALTEAALRNLGQHDEGDRVEAAAMRLAAAVDAKPDELPALLIHCIGDRQVALFAALLGSALRIDFPMARAIVIERDAALWLALRAAEFDRPTIARLGLALAPDVEAFANGIEAIMATDLAAARAALARYALHPDLRAALAAIGAAR